MISQSFRFSRREFVRSTAAGVAVGTMVVRSWAQSPNEKLGVAVIGVGGQGGAQLGAAGAQENVVALCDVDDHRLGKAAEQYPQAEAYNDFRKMLDEMDKQIDAVMVSTPDHIHAPASVTAMRMGKHCYCEKPLTHSVLEARTAAEIANKNKLATQMGTQIHAGENYRRVVELIQSGAIGPVDEVHVWCGKNWGGGRRPAEETSAPDWFHWDLWLGPAPWRPYHECYAPAQWRRHWDFGNGTLGDMACHFMDLPFWALSLRHPTTVEAEGPPVDPEGCPEKLIVRYEFPARGQMPPLKFTWYDGSNRPNLPQAEQCGVPIGGSGVLFVGQEGMLRADYGSKQLFPKEKFADFQPPEPTIPKSIGHHAEFFQACKTGSPTTCNFDYSGALTEAVLLGTVAYRTGTKLEWNGSDLKAANCPEAGQYLAREYRKGWTL